MKNIIEKTLKCRLKRFRPNAYYDGHADSIVIELKDCSMTEIGFDKGATFLIDNFPKEGDPIPIGLFVHGIRHMGLKDPVIAYAVLVLNEAITNSPELVQEFLCTLYTHYCKKK